MSNEFEMKNSAVENEIYSLLVAWLIFEIDKKDDKKRTERNEDLQLIEQLNQIEAPKQLKSTLLHFLRHYDNINPRIAFELTKVLSLARIRKGSELITLLLQILEFILHDKAEKPSGFRGENEFKNHIKNAFESGVIDSLEYNIISKTKELSHHINEANNNPGIFPLISLIEIILRLDYRTKSQMFSIGYGNRTSKDFLNCLVRYNIKCLVDVRSKPFSKFNPDFSKSAIETMLHENGIEYEFFGEYLGGRPEDSSSYLEDGRVDYEIVRDKSFFRKGIELLKQKFATKGRVAIMCSELKPEDCHRSKLIGEFLTSQVGLSLLHINENGDLKSQKEIMTLVTGGLTTNNLFGESALTSRKKYN